MNLMYSIMFIGSMLVAKPFSGLFPLHSELVYTFYVCSALLYYGYYLRD